MDVVLPVPDFEARLDASGLQSGTGSGDIPAFAPAQLDKLRGTRPTAHKVDGWILCAAPLATGAALVHGYRTLPKGVPLSDLIRAVDAASKHVPAPDQSTGQDATDRLRAAAVALSKVPQKKRLSQALYAIRDAGVPGVAALALIKGGKIKKMHFATKSDANVRDELRAVIAANAPDNEAVELDLIASSLGARKGRLFRPDDPDNGVVFFGVDLSGQHAAAFEKTHGFFAMLTDINPKKGRRVRAFWGMGLLAALVAIAFYLAAPAPVYVSNFAQARASQSLTLALPFGAFLDQSMVRPGQMLEAGDVVAVLRSPEIESGIAEEKVRHALELINAQDALNAGNYGEFQLAEKRAEIALLRQQQLEDRQAQLTVVAPVASRVVTALPDGERGNFLPTGSSVITLQPTMSFDLLIDVAPQDSALVAVGQTGHVFFRGLSDETFAFEVLSTANQIRDPDTGAMRTQVRAGLVDVDQADLLVGLSGFAKIETRTAPRIVGLTRPLVEYIRLSLWKTLGSTF